MFTLITLIITGIAAALFATQNTQLVSIYIGGYSFSNLPLYLVVLLAALAGILISFCINSVNSVFTSITMHDKEGSLSKAKKEIAELSKEVHQLEIENTRLKTQLGEADDEDSL